jgi:hypothetical protein
MGSSEILAWGAIHRLGTTFAFLSLGSRLSQSFRQRVLTNRAKSALTCANPAAIMIKLAERTHFLNGGFHAEITPITAT